MSSSNDTSYDLITPEAKGIINDAIAQVLVVMNFVVTSGTISFFGVIFNAINVVVFFHQGFKDTVTISLFGLAVADLCSLLTLLWMSVCFNPWLDANSLTFDPIDIQYLTAGWPHVCFARITSWITAFITFERCLCIALPLKVKTIITPRRVFFVIVAIYLTMIGSVVPVYYAIGLGQKASVNKTWIGLVYRSNGPFIENISFTVNVFSQLASFFSVIACTAIITHNLSQKSKWRKEATNANQDSSSSRDKKVIKLVVLISTIFIACFVPSATNLVAMILLDQYSIVGQYKNMFLVTWAICNALEATNSSVNIFVYYRMSSKYREVFRGLFKLKTETQRK